MKIESGVCNQKPFEYSEDKNLRNDVLGIFDLWTPEIVVSTRLELEKGNVRNNISDCLTVFFSHEGDVLDCKNYVKFTGKSQDIDEVFEILEDKLASFLDIHLLDTQVANSTTYNKSEESA